MGCHSIARNTTVVSDIHGRDVADSQFIAVVDNTHTPLHRVGWYQLFVLEAISDDGSRKSQSQ